MTAKPCIRVCAVRAPHRRCVFTRPFCIIRALACALIVSFAVAGGSAFARPPSVSPPWNDWLTGAGVDPGEAGVAVWRLDAPGLGRPFWSVNGERPFNPASTIKLLTTWAAMSLLGPDYRWRTAIHLRGRLVDGVLDGDLVLRGGGDPKLVAEDMTEWIARMRAAGLRDIRGDLVIDDSVFEPVDENRPAFDGDASQPYNVLPFGALLNFKAARIVVRPREQRALVEFDPPLADVAIDNRISVQPGPCRDGAWGLRVSEGPSRPSGAPVVRIEGRYSKGCGDQGRFAAVLGHAEFARAFFAGAWRASGGTWDGRARIERGAARGDPWMDWVSPRTLAEIVDDVNHFSNNVMARQLLLQIAASHGHSPARVGDGERAIEAWLASRGLAFPELVLDNGAGLSRHARISPVSLVRVLVDVDGSELSDRFRESLPRVGQTGTVKFRLTGAPLAGRAWMKTGSLAEVRTIAGYLQAASGRRYALALFVNGPRARESAALQDRLLTWLYENG
jgi:serine-type D-Ala-D-Ala carboxypeptidase/endopeptidase (penicillin-binding protein 4)